MDWRGRVKTALGILVVLFVVAMILGQVLGQPILLGYVTSRSMEPTINTGDGYVSIPSAVAGPIEKGDVVVFQAQKLHGGSLTTHRIVGKTDRGYLTKGDANPFTDQDGGEPPVKPEQIVAVVLTVNGHVVVVPQLGTVVTSVHSFLQTAQIRLAVLFGSRALLGTQGLAYLVFGATIVLYALDVWLEDDKQDERSRERDQGQQVWHLLAIMALALVLAATVTMVVPSGSKRFDVVSSEFQSDRPNVIQQGTNKSVTFVLGNGGRVPEYVFLESGTDRLDVTPHRLTLGGTRTRNATVTFSAPPETGAYRYYLTQHRYLAILPRGTTQALYEIHPWLPIVCIDLLIGVPFFLVGLLVVGRGRVRNRSRSGPDALDRFRSRLW